MSKKSPLLEVNESFGGKDKLVEKLVGLLESDESKEDLRQKLLGVANGKLLRLHRVATAVKEKFGSRDKLVAELASGRKDKDYTTRLEGFSTARLADMARVAAPPKTAAKPKADKAPAKPKADKVTAKAKPAGKSASAK